jgi:heme exporter protein B
MMLLSALSPLGLAGAKMAAHWAVTGLPLCLATLVVAQMLNVPPETLPVLFFATAAGTLYMSLLGGFGAFLTLGAKRPGVLLAVVVLPLWILRMIHRAHDRQRLRRRRVDGTQDEATAAYPAVTDDA